jgi:serine/threonine protein kinase
VPTDLTDVISVAAGKYHSLALRKDGRTVAWGMFVDLHNQTNVVHIAAAEYYSLAVTSSGTVLYGGWDRTTPTGETLRLQSAAEVTKVSVGGKHSLALTKQGHVEAWGLNDSGQCDVPVWLTDVDQIAAGGPFSLAKLRDGNVVTWGGNSIIDIQSLVQIGESKKLEYVHPFLQGQGGEAQLYSTPSGLLKRYISPDKTPATGKFEYMMKYPIIFEPYQRPLVAWPKQMAFDPFTGELVGYVMPFISAMQLQYLIDPLKRYRYFPELTSDEQRYQQFVFTVSSWCAKVLDFIHSQQYIVGDLSPRNIMIYPDMTVAFIDCASYQIKDGDEYGCYVGTPDYQAPEVNRLPDGRLQYTVHSDAFALAVVIFRLMSVHNVHPYQGITLPSAKLMPELYQITKESYPHLEPISDEVDATSYCEEHRIWPYDPSQRICVPPVAMQSQYALLPSALRTLFRRAFTGAPNQRPTPLEWAQTIDEIRMQHS